MSTPRVAQVTDACVDRMSAPLTKRSAARLKHVCAALRVDAPRVATLTRADGAATAASLEQQIEIRTDKVCHNPAMGSQ